MKNLSLRYRFNNADVVIEEKQSRKTEWKIQSKKAEQE